MAPSCFTLKSLLTLCLFAQKTNSLLTGNCTALVSSYGIDAIQHLDVTDANGVYSITPPTMTVIPMPTSGSGDPWYLHAVLDPLDPNTLLSFHLIHAWFTTQPNFIATIEVNCTDNGITTGPCHYSTGPVNGFPYGPWSIYNPTPSGIYTMQYTAQSAINITNNIGYLNIDPSAVWVSNGQQYDQIDFLFNFSTITCETPTPAPTVAECVAKICAHGDDSVTLDVSYDGGSNWDLSVASEANWVNTMSFNVNPVDSDTILRFTVSDSGGYAGFIATVQLCGGNDYIWSFFTDEINTYFDVISDSSSDPLVDVFHEFGSGPWLSSVNSVDVQCMNTDADWIWNDHNGNTMVFELNFGHHLDILKRLDCVEDLMPTECCDYSVDEYLDECYCDVTPTVAPTPATAPIHVVTAVEIKDDKLFAVGGQSVGVNMMKDVHNDNTLFDEKMDRIEYMIYATWIILFIQFFVLLFVFGKRRNRTAILENKL